MPPSPVENARARVGVVSNPCPTGSVQPQMPCYDWAASLLDRQVRKVLDMDSSTNALGATYNASACVVRVFLLSKNLWFSQ